MDFEEAKTRQVDLFKNNLYTQIVTSYVEDGRQNYMLIDCDKHTAETDILRHAVVDIKRWYMIKNKKFMVIQGGKHE